MNLGKLVGHAARGISIKDPFKTRSSSSSQLTYTGTLTLRKATFLLDVGNVVGSVIDNTFELLGKGIDIHLISSTAVDPGTGNGKTSKAGCFPSWSSKIVLFTGQDVKYKVEFHVDCDFGIPGAFTVKNKHLHEFYLLRLELNISGGKHVVFPCNSWVFPSSNYKTDRIFFSNELYLPGDTPPGLVSARRTDLKALQGDGTGIRAAADRIYDYDVYNDLGSDRPVIGGLQLPYPRRCRTGRRVNGEHESRDLLPVIQRFYLPADEVFASEKNSNFLGGTVKGLLHSVVPNVGAFFSGKFQSFKELDLIYDNGFDISKLVTLPLRGFSAVGFKSPFQLVNQVVGTPGQSNSSLLKFPRPQIVKADRKAWMSDEEFARQMLSGPNPLMIECLQYFPPTSQLPNATTSLTEFHISSQLEGKTMEQALREKKLFILNFYDAFMPFVEKINCEKSVFTYATRTVLFLKSDGTLKPVAIELSTPSTQRVLTPPTTPESDWLWELAKVHVASNDAGYHQLVSHWLRTHCCIEPFIIAMHRQLSHAHPLNPFLRPHFKNTMSINALARQILINSKGIVEFCFTPGKYSMEMTSAVYRNWNLFNEGLPSDLLKRGMAIPEPSAKHGLKLLIEDYPYAADGLEIWAALEKWTESYINIVYKDDQSVENDTELQRWRDEVINYGHPDKRHETWWGKLDTKKRLVQTLTTIIWVVSAHHAAVNFSQYAYHGYMPNHPTKTHEPIPDLGSPEYTQMQKNKEAWFLKSVSRKDVAIKMMLTLEILSTHAEDEEYLGERLIQDWTTDENALRAFRDFGQQLKFADEIMSARNKDPKLKNRRGPAQVPYTLLASTSEPGITGRGVPNSISI